MTERLIEAGGVSLCAEAYGDPADPPVLLVMGMGASMLWWDEAFCAALADGGRFVVRYDHRDTGRSQSAPPGRPDYGGEDLVADAARVLDGFGIARAHVVGVSMGGALAQLIALDFPHRVASLVLISTSPAGPADDLPAPTEDYRAFAANAPEVDWADAASVVEYHVAETRALSGARTFDEGRVRSQAERDVARAISPASAQNHALLDGGAPWRGRLATLDTPTLVIHGSADPLFPLGHGRALANEIPDARLLVLDGAGHVLDPADHDAVAAAILDHTAGSLSRRSRGPGPSARTAGSSRWPRGDRGRWR